MTERAEHWETQGHGAGGFSLGSRPAAGCLLQPESARVRIALRCALIAEQSLQNNYLPGDLEVLGSRVGNTEKMSRPSWLPAGG
jgi:hypothetical protein